MTPHNKDTPIDRPNETSGRRRCGLCDAVIAFWPRAAVRHCAEMPWVASPTPIDPSDEEVELSKANRDCLAKAKPGEPMFIILGRDPDGGNIVRLWAQRRKDAGDPDHAGPVFEIADAMDEWADDPANAPESAPDRSRYTALRSPVPRELREALEPFAREAENYDFGDGSGPDLHGSPDASSLNELNDLLVGDLRRAKRAYDHLIQKERSQ